MVGGIGLLINLSVTFLFTEFFGLWYFWSYLIGTLISWTCSFFLNARFTFVSVPKTLKSWLGRYVIFIGGYLAFFWVNAGIVFVLTSLFNVSYLISIITGAVLTMFGTFTLSRTVIFAPEKKGSGDRWNGLALRVKNLSFLRKCLLLFFIAIGVGVITVAPQVYFILHAPSYQGIALMGSDAEEDYVAQIQQVYDGYPTASEPFLLQKNVPYMQPPLGQILVASIGKLTQMNAVAVNVFSKFLFPFLIVILVSLLAYTLSGSYAVGLLSGPMVVLGDTLVSSPSAWIGLLRGTSSVTDFLSYARPINPEVSALFLFAVLWIYYVAFLKRRHPRVIEMVALGFLIGASLYISLFVCTFLLTLGGLGALWFLYKRDFRFFWASFVVGVSAVIAVIPFILNYLRLSKEPAYAESSLRLGLVLSHAPTLSIWILLLLAGTLFAWPKRFANARPLILLSSLALLLLDNQQILTGHSLQPSHYHWYITKPLVGIVLSFYIVYLADKFARSSWVRGLVYAAVLFVLFYQAALVDIASYRANAPLAIANQAYAPVLSYLRTYKEPQGVWANQELSQEISIYTSDAAPDNAYLAYYLAPQSFMTERLLVEYKLRGILPGDAYVQMQQERVALANELFGVYWRDQAGSYAAIPNRLFQGYAKEYPQVYAMPYASLFTQLGVTLIVWDRVQDPEWKLDAAAGLTAVYSNARFTVYKVQ
jgi:putative flippase GtrA